MRASDETEDFHSQRAARGDGLHLGAKYKVFTRNLLTLSVLVQNRRKDKMKILMFPARTQLVSFENTSSDVLKGRSEMDKLSTFQVNEHTLAVMGVAEDPWSKNRRVLLKNFNGIDIKEGKPLPPSVHDVERGIVSLRPGEYVVFSAQFRLGDGDTITTDWEAFERLSCASLAFSLWEQGADPCLLDDILAQFLGRNGHAPEGLRMPFDHPTMVDFYHDYLVYGEEAFIRSHYGAERVEILKKSSRMVELLGKGLTRQLEDSMDMDAMIAQLRASGLQDMADGLDECRRRLRER
ncbi:hypothetical protein C8Q80DRAFT_1269228 [Daedaleopsis nitida]|nr:hypothetical protein C8Q80DRAFT_1269228 [Daedaleopsis nitida]